MRIDIAGYEEQVYVKSTARAAWISYLDENPRRSEPLTFSIHDFPDGRIPPLDEHDPSDLI
jgi:hypothetical protein